MPFGSGMQLQQLAPLMQLFAQLQSGGGFGMQRPPSPAAGPALSPEQQRAALMAPQGGQFFQVPNANAWGMIGSDRLFNEQGMNVGAWSGQYMPDVYKLATPPWMQSLQPTMGAPLQRPDIAPVAPSPVTGSPTGATNPAVATISQPAPEIKSQIAMDPFRQRNRGIFGGGFGAF